MVKKKEENIMFPYPYPYFPPSINGEDPIATYQKVHEFLEKLKKENEENAKKKKKPEPRKFTFLETFGMCIFFGPILGFGYLYMVKAALIQVELWFK